MPASLAAQIAVDYSASVLVMSYSCCNDEAARHKLRAKR